MSQDQPNHAPLDPSSTINPPNLTDQQWWTQRLQQPIPSNLPTPEATSTESTTHQAVRERAAIFIRGLVSGTPLANPRPLVGMVKFVLEMPLIKIPGMTRQERDAFAEKLSGFDPDPDSLIAKAPDGLVEKVTNMLIGRLEWVLYGDRDD